MFANAIQNLVAELINVLSIYARENKQVKLSHDQFLTLMNIMNDRISKDIINQIFKIGKGLPINLMFENNMVLKTNIDIDENDIATRELEKIESFSYRLAGVTLTGNFNDKDTKIVYFGITFIIDPSIIDIDSSLEKIHKLQNNIAIEYDNSAGIVTLSAVEGIYLINNLIKFPDNITEEYPLCLIKLRDEFKLYKDEGYRIIVPENLTENNYTLINLTNISDGAGLILSSKFIHGIVHPPSVKTDIELKTDNGITLYKFSKDNDNYYSEYEIPYDIDTIDYSSVIDITMGSSFDILTEITNISKNSRIKSIENHVKEVMKAVINNLDHSIGNMTDSHGLIPVERLGSSFLNILGGVCKIGFKFMTYDI